MAVTPGFNKQISYPDFLIRLLAISIDVPLVAFFTMPVMPYVSLYLFQDVMHDFLTLHNVTINSPNDILQVIASEQFQAEINANKVSAFYKGIICALGPALFQYVVISFYFIISWTIFGATLGKFLLKMKIVNLKTLQKPSLISSILRYLFYILGPISIFYLFFNKQKRAIHDYVAETIVIKS